MLQRSISAPDLSSLSLEGEEVLPICLDVSEEGPREFVLTSAGRRWPIVASFSGGVVTLLVRDPGLADDEIGFINVRVVDPRPGPPAVQRLIHGIVYPRQPCQLKLVAVAELLERGFICIAVGLYTIAPPFWKSKSSLCGDQVNLLECGDGSDITFHVGNKDFPAHRSIILERSPALAAMVLAAPESSITIEGDVEPKVFAAFLKFLYTDDLPCVEEILGGEGFTKEDALMMAQKLFIVAERFKHERLKAILEKRMVAELDVSTAVRTLVFAVEHGLGHLQAKCCQIIVSNGWLKEVVRSEGFIGMSSLYSSAVKDALLIEIGRALEEIPSPYPLEVPFHVYYNSSSNDISGDQPAQTPTRRVKVWEHLKRQDARRAIGEHLPASTE